MVPPAESQRVSSPPRQPTTFERVASIVAAALVLLLIAFLVIRNQPFADPNLAMLTRIVLSLAIAVLGATIPGFLNVSWSGLGGAIKAGGALALFVVSLLYTPKVLPLGSDPSREEYDEAVNAYALGQYDDVIGHLRSFPSASPTYRLAVSLRGTSEFRLGHYALALADYQEALRASTNRRQELQAQFNIGLAQMCSKNYLEAKKILMPLVNTAEMGDDRSVIYNAASALFHLDEIDSAQTLFAKFPLTAPVPSDPDSHDLFGKAHWLAASLLVSKNPPDCDTVNAEIAAALAVKPELKADIATAKNLDVCTKAQGVKK
jgi:tetratricopeptide (TPR) repeat protein